MMNFGLTQFGMTTIGAITLVTGAALATADVAGRNEVVRLFAGQGNAYSTVTGYGRRAANQKPVTAYASASANIAQAKVLFNPLPSTALCTAVANIAKARVDFNTYTFATAYATVQGAARRLTKIYPLRAECTATGEGDSQTWQMAYANPAVATAEGFGTTYHLVYGQAVCTATIEDHPRLQVGGRGTALATCEGNQATALFQIGVAGLGEGVCSVQGDPAVTHEGIRYFEVNGDALAFAMALSTHVGVTQSQTGRGFAFAEGHVRYNFGGRGHAECTAIGWANPEVLGTGASLTEGNTTAYGYGAAQALIHGKGSAAASATGYGAGEKKLTREQTNPALAFATLNTPAGHRVSLVSGVAQAQATTQTLFVDRGVRLTPAQCVALLSRPAIELSLYPQAAEAFAEITADSLKILVGSGEATASATANGYNEINDLVPAPAERTVIVEAFDRLVVVVNQPRLVLV